MRIFLICLQSQIQHPVPAYKFWESYFKNGLEEAGHEWIEAPDVDWAEALVYTDEESLAKWRDRTWSKTISFIKQQHQIKPIDLCLSYLFPKQVEPSAVQAIQTLGIPCVNFFCDNVREFIRIPQEFYCFNLHWVPEFKALKKYQQAKLNYIHAAMPMWIPPNQRSCNHPDNYGVSFIGTRDVLRENLFAQVIKQGIAIELRGTGWDKSELQNFNFTASRKSLWKTLLNQKDFIAKSGIQAYLWKASYQRQPKIPDSFFEDYVRKKPNAIEYTFITQQSLVTLGVNRYPSYRYPLSHPDTYSRLRDLEAPMLGACYLTEWTEGLDQLYDLGEEIETYRTPEEMAEKTRQLLGNSEKRQKMRCAGQKRALSEHTVPQSLAKVAYALDLK